MYYYYVFNMHKSSAIFNFLRQSKYKVPEPNKAPFKILDHNNMCHKNMCYKYGRKLLLIRR